MSKAILSINYTDIVMDIDTAVHMYRLLNKETIWRHETYWTTDDNGKNTEMHKVTPMNYDVKLRGVSDEDFAVWKIAGEVNK